MFILKIIFGLFSKELNIQFIRTFKTRAEVKSFSNGIKNTVKQVEREQEGFHL